MPGEAVTKYELSLCVIIVYLVALCASTTVPSRKVGILEVKGDQFRMQPVRFYDISSF
jgi:hypothetical protein